MQLRFAGGRSEQLPEAATVALTAAAARVSIMSWPLLYGSGSRCDRSGCQTAIKIDVCWGVGWGIGLEIGSIVGPIVMGMGGLHKGRP
ncbi:MAG: hypothetical protein VKJ85_05305 [Prochlorothrix sp.]|nr:hypothetical protein [Prochlorothrix sp.]